jgi:Tol biopolymer transport system component
MSIPELLHAGITDHIHRVRISADGGQIAFSSNRSGRYQIYVNRHRVVPKDEILSVVWDGVAVSDNALTRAVAQIRKALEDDRALTKKGLEPFNPSAPTWLADGRHVVFSSRSPGPLGSGNAGLWVVDSETGALRKIHAGTTPQ